MAEEYKLQAPLTAALVEQLLLRINTIKNDPRFLQEFLEILVGLDDEFEGKANLVSGKVPIGELPKYLNPQAIAATLTDHYALTTAGNVKAILEHHDNSPTAHQELTAEITAQADRAEAAADTATAEFDGVLQAINAITADPANAVNQIWIPAQALENMQGAPVLSKAASRLPCWLLPDSVTSYLSTAIRMPSHWNTMYVYFVIANTTANSGAPVLSAEAHNWSIGDSINATPSGSSKFENLPTSAWVAYSMRTAAEIAVDPSKTTTLRIGRSGSSANDTLPNDVALVGVILEKVA